MFTNRWSARRSGEAPSAAPAAQSGSWSLSPVDGAIAACILAVTGCVSVQAALHFHRQVVQLDQERQAALSRMQTMRTTLKQLETHRLALAQLRRDVDRYMSDVTARPIVAWSTEMAELSRRRPKGVWTTEISGDGPRFRMQVTAATPALAQSYAQSLRESPYIDFAVLPVGESTSAHTQVSGRWTGD